MVIHTRPCREERCASHRTSHEHQDQPRAEVTVDKVLADKKDVKEFPPMRLKRLNAGTRDAGFLHPEHFESGTSVSIELEGRYQKKAVVASMNFWN